MRLFLSAFFNCFTIISHVMSDYSSDFLIYFLLHLFIPSSLFNFKLLKLLDSSNWGVVSPNLLFSNNIDEYQMWRSKVICDQLYRRLKSNAQMLKVHELLAFFLKAIEIQKWEVILQMYNSLDSFNSQSLFW